MPARREKHAARKLDLPAFLWGLAEATFFFIVPDVWITFRALHGIKRGLNAALFAAAGALPGGALMYWLGTVRPEAVRMWLDAVPAVSAAMIENVGEQLARLGLWGLFLGPLSGTPYKIYAALAPQAGFSLPVLLAVSLPARLLRFVLLAGVSAAAGRWLKQHFGFRAALWTWALLWSAFYVLWFSLMPG
jgi:membrane protein YqaA with SNARE-associated domain